jgi:hypothetical protein
MSNKSNTTEVSAPSASTLAFGPKEIKAKYASLVGELMEAGTIVSGKSASCGKNVFLSIYAGMLVEMGVIPPAAYAATFAVLDELPANASAMRQDFEKWGEVAAASAKGSALASKYGG